MGKDDDGGGEGNDANDDDDEIGSGLLPLPRAPAPCAALALALRRRARRCCSRRPRRSSAIRSTRGCRRRAPRAPRWCASTFSSTISSATSTECRPTCPSSSTHGSAPPRRPPPPPPPPTSPASASTSLPRSTRAAPRPAHRGRRRRRAPAAAASPAAADASPRRKLAAAASARPAGAAAATASSASFFTVGVGELFELGAPPAADGSGAPPAHVGGGTRLLLEVADAAAPRGAVEGAARTPRSPQRLPAARQHADTRRRRIPSRRGARLGGEARGGAPCPTLRSRVAAPRRAPRAARAGRRGDGGRRRRDAAHRAQLLLDRLGSADGGAPADALRRAALLLSGAAAQADGCAETVGPPGSIHALHRGPDGEHDTSGLGRATAMCSALALCVGAAAAAATTPPAADGASLVPATGAGMIPGRPTAAASDAEVRELLGSLASSVGALAGVVRTLVERAVDAKPPSAEREQLGGRYGGWYASLLTSRKLGDHARASGLLTPEQSVAARLLAAREPTALLRAAAVREAAAPQLLPLLLTHALARPTLSLPRSRLPRRRRRPRAGGGGDGGAGGGGLVAGKGGRGGGRRPGRARTRAGARARAGTRARPRGGGYGQGGRRRRRRRREGGGGGGARRVGAGGVRPACSARRPQRGGRRRPSRRRAVGRRGAAQAVRRRARPRPGPALRRGTLRLRQESRARGSGICSIARRWPLLGRPRPPRARRRLPLVAAVARRLSHDAAPPAPPRPPP